MRPPRCPTSVLVGLLAALLATAGPARGEEPTVPVNLQADLLFTIAGHDLNLAARAGAVVKTLVLAKGDDASRQAAAQFRQVAAERPKVGALPHQVEEATFSTPAALAEAVRAQRLSIVYLAPGFSVAEVTAIGQALDGLSVLSVSPVPAMARRGPVLCFSLVSGHARILLDPGQAARQQVAFSPEVLHMVANSP